MISGCQSENTPGSASQSTSTPTSGASAAGTSTQASIPEEPSLEAPIQAFVIQAADFYTLQTAEDALSAQCMTRFGFQPQVEERNREGMIANQRESEGRLYGITDEGVARVSGYMPSERMMAQPEDKAPPSDSYLFVLLGQDPNNLSPNPDSSKSPGKVGGIEIPPGGCLGEARVKIWGTADSQVPDQFARQLKNDAYFAAVDDPAVKKAISDWSRCMAKSGYSYGSPLDTEFDRELGSTPSETEISTAVADVQCKKKTDLVNRWNARNVAHQISLIEKNQLALNELRKNIDLAIAKATDVVGN
jgi:hypothetical protein